MPGEKSFPMISTTAVFDRKDKRAIAQYLVSLGCKASGSFGVPKRMTFEVPCILGNADLRSHFEAGAYSYVGRDADIWSAKIGRFCSLARRVSIGPPEHPTTFLSTHPFTFGSGSGFWADPYYAAIAQHNDPKVPNATVEIGNDVWIGDGVFIRAGVKIGHGAVIAGRSVVLHDVPAYAVLAGVPAKVKRLRFPERVVESLLATRWWELDLRRSRLDYTDPEACAARIEEIRAGQPTLLLPAVYQSLCMDGDRVAISPHADRKGGGPRHQVPSDK